MKMRIGIKLVYKSHYNFRYQNSWYTKRYTKILIYYWYENKKAKQNCILTTNCCYVGLVALQADIGVDKQY